MIIINVVTIKNGVVDEIESFGVAEEQFVQDVVDEAEDCFLEKAKLLGFDPEENDVDDLMDDAYYSIANASVCISWSTIENVQI